MKGNRIERKTGRRSVLTFLALVLLAAVLGGVAFAYTKLRDIYLEQCVVTDATEQVAITSGKLVKADVVAWMFGLTNGANLARIDYAARREECLRRHPAIRSLAITRRLPNRVEITVVERTPEVRLNLAKRKAETGRVADSDGVVFKSFRGTGTLPVIREAAAKATPPGKKLPERSLSALRLIEVASDAEFADMRILEVDATHPDYLVATFGNYARAKIAWEGMDNPTAANQKNLVTRLRQLRDAMRTRAAIGIGIWNATMPNKIFADTKDKIL